MLNIRKVFPGGVVANDDVSLAVQADTIHAVIGENGAGKTTLMNILYGRYQPDAGRICVEGQEVRIQSPAHAISLGIGMVTQHTTMIPALTALENVILGAEPTAGGYIQTADGLRRVREVAKRLEVDLDWRARAGSLSVAALQKAEIVKALYRGARILVLDEPSATLAPQEAEALFAVLHSLVDSGATVLLVTHKLREVMAHCDQVTVMRGGHRVADRAVSETYPEELRLLMLGQGTTIRGVSMDRAPAPTPIQAMPWDERARFAPVPTLEMAGVTVLNARRAPAIHSVSLNVQPGEVLGIAGVDGSGQKELAEAVVGLRSVQSGRITLQGEDITNLTVGERLHQGIAYIPEDRHREGLVLDFSIAENMLLGREHDSEFGGGRVLNLTRVHALGGTAVRDHRIRAGGGDVKAGTLSGGNQQKVVIARALASEPRLLVAVQPTRGLDVEATRFVYESLRRGTANGLSILLFSLDLDEIFELSDRIAVMYNGQLAGILPRIEATQEAVGRLMVEGRA